MKWFCRICSVLLFIASLYVIAYWFHALHDRKIWWHGPTTFLIFCLTPGAFGCIMLSVLYPWKQK